MSLLGDLGYVWRKIWLTKFAQKYNIRQEFVTAGENKIKLNPFEDLKPQDEKWMKNTLYTLEHDLKSGIIKNRNEHFLKLKVSL